MGALEEEAPGATAEEPEKEMASLTWSTDGLYLSSLELQAEMKEQIDLMAVKRDNETVTFGLDSGAAVTIIPRSSCVDYPLIAPKEDITYTAAGGQQIADEGSRHIFVKPPKEAPRCIRARVGNVRKALLAVADLTDTGHRVTFDDDFGLVEHKKSGSTLYCPKARRVFEAQLPVIPYAQVPNDLGQVRR